MGERARTLILNSAGFAPSGGTKVRLCLDAAPVIYLLEGDPDLRREVETRLAGTRAGNDVAVVSELARLECRVKPMGEGDIDLLRTYDTFFAAEGIEIVPTDRAVWERATEIRARYGFKIPDAVHLAAPVLHGCRRFLTNDHPLKGFPDIPIDLIGT